MQEEKQLSKDNSKEEQGYIVKNGYSNNAIRISDKGIRHGLNGDFVRLSVNGRLTTAIGKLLENAIPVNALYPKQTEVANTYVIVGYAADKKNEAIALIHVNQSTNLAETIEFLDVVHSLNGRIKEIDNNSTGRSAKPPQHDPVKGAVGTDATISIENLLNVVKDLSPDVLSKDVKSRLGIPEDVKGYYRDNVLFSTRPDTNYDLIKNIDPQQMEALVKVLEGMREGRRFGSKSFGMWAIKDITRILDSISGKDRELRNYLFNMIERPLNEAGGIYSRGVRDRQKELLTLMNELNIKTKEQSAAIQNYGEGHYLHSIICAFYKV